jgi:hypothetical protein
MLTNILKGAGRVLALGAPSVARRLEAEGAIVTLVDRQPMQGVSGHVCSEVENFDVQDAFDAAIIDPPWYALQLVDWAAVAARAVGTDGSVLLSAWPHDARPGAGPELDDILDAIRSWAEVERGLLRLPTNSLPLKKARASSAAGPLSRSPLQGELVRLIVKSKPASPRATKSNREWTRFTVDDYQIAVRSGGTSLSPGISMVPNAEGWIWPFVSARAPGLEHIIIWSSDGEVASADDPASVIAALRTAFAAENAGAFEKALVRHPELLEWRSPAHPTGDRWNGVTGDSPTLP